jgi:hypothetical protein
MAARELQAGTGAGVCAVRRAQWDKEREAEIREVDLPVLDGSPGRQEVGVCPVV